jgi:hypothetical protein
LEEVKLERKTTGVVLEMNGPEHKNVEIKKKKATVHKSRSKARKGSQKLREAADKVMGRDSKKIAEALSENGKKGQLQSIRFMYELSDAEPDEVDGASKIRSMALEMANAPQWTGPTAKKNENSVNVVDSGAGANSERSNVSDQR